MMSKLGLSQRDGRTLLAGGITIASLVIVARGIPAVRDWETSQMSQAHSAAQQLAALRAGLRVLPALRDSLRARRARLVVLDSTLLVGGSPSDVAAALASTLEDLADDNSLKVTALQLHADSSIVDGFARVDVRLTGIADVAGLAGFLHAIEGGNTPLVVRDLSVSQPEPAANDSKPEALRIDLLVAGIGRIKAPPTTASMTLGARP